MMACAPLVQAPQEYRRSFDAFAAAFHEASRNRHTEVMAVLGERAHEIEAPAAWVVMRSLVGLLARKTGQTPRSILEGELANAPSDDVWRAFGGPMNCTQNSNVPGMTPARRRGALAHPRVPDATGRPSRRPLD